MSYRHDTLEHHPQDAVSSPTCAYFPPSKTTSITPTLSAAFSEKLATTLVSKKTYINLPSIQKVIASHSSKRAEDANAPDYDEAVANIPDLDLLPPPPVYDIVNCPTSQTLLLVSSLINTILAVNDRLACPKITLFHSRAIPNISIEAYLSRILQYAPFQNEVLLIILLYFDRIGAGCKPTQVLTNTIPKRLLRQASMTTEDINRLTVPRAENGENAHKRQDDKADPARFNPASRTAQDDWDSMDDEDEEELIADEIYTSSSESPAGSKLIINSFNIHRLLITSILVASKFSSDVFYPNVRYARVGGLPLSELNQLELEFLFLSQFGLNTTEAELQSYGNKLLMYHQRLNGTERAAIDAITPAKGEYVRLIEKNHRLHEGKPTPPRIQTAVQPRHRPSSEVESRVFVSAGPYRDSKEIMDDDEVMSEKADDQVGSPTDWQSGQSSPVTQEQTPVTKYSTQRSNKMNLNHMIWPTNEMDTQYTPSSYYGAMVKDEDAARIEEEFKKATPPPESAGEPHPKRKLQRLSSGTLDTVPAKRANTPSKKDDSEKSSQGGSNNKNILKPLFRKIASFASHRSDAAATPAAPVEPDPATPSLRSHPYLIRHKISPASSSTNVGDSEDVTSPTTPTSRTISWQHEEYASPSPRHVRAPPAFQTKSPQAPAPPPYSGQDPEGDHERHSRSMMTQSGPYKTSASSSPSSRGGRQYRSRESSLSALASELTFEPTRSSLSPMHEESNHDATESTTTTTTLAPLYFPPRPQAIQGTRTVQLYPGQSYSTPPATPMDRRDGSSHLFDFASPSSSSNTQTMASPSSEVADDDDNAMQCDEQPPATSSVPGPSDKRHYHSEPLVVSGSSMSVDVDSSREKHKMRTSERILTEGLNTTGAPSSSWLSSSTFVSVNGQGAAAASIAGKQPIPMRHALAPAQPHYVASYYAAAPPPNVQLVSRPQAIPIMTGNGQSSSSSSSKPLLAPAVARPTRQFAPIRPRTPITIEDDPKSRVPQSPPAESASSTQRKKKGSSSLEPKQQQQPPLRPLVPTVFAPAATGAVAAASPPPYRPPFIAYPAPYTHIRAPDGSTIRPPAPMLMAVDYTHGGLAAAGHAPQFIAAAPPGHGGHNHPGAARVYIPVIPVMYNKPLPTVVPVPATPLMSGKAPGKTTTLAKIAPRLHRPS